MLMHLQKLLKSLQWITWQIWGSLSQSVEQRILSQYGEIQVFIHKCFPGCFCMSLVVLENNDINIWCCTFVDVLWQTFPNWSWILCNCIWSWTDQRCYCWWTGKSNFDHVAKGLVNINHDILKDMSKCMLTAICGTEGTAWKIIIFGYSL